MPSVCVIPEAEGQREAYAWGEMRWIASGGRGNCESMTFGEVVIRAGHSNPAHSHPNCEEILYLIAGRLEHRAGDEVFQMGPGDTLVVRRELSHHARAIGSDDARMVVAYSTPDREIAHET